MKWEHFKIDEILLHKPDSIWKKMCAISSSHLQNINSMREKKQPVIMTSFIIKSETKTKQKNIIKMLLFGYIHSTSCITVTIFQKFCVGAFSLNVQ